MKIKELISENLIQKRVAELGNQIENDYQNKSILFIGVLNGACLFMSDLVRTITNKLDIEIDFVAISSYGNNKESGNITFSKDLKLDITDKNVIIVEDIIDSGRTMDFLTKHLLSKGANTVKVCTFLSKPSRRQVDIKFDYVGYEIDDVFVVGYGLDDAEKFRHLRYIGYIPSENETTNPNYWLV